MLKKVLYILLIAGILTNTCSCALLQKPIDKRTGFSSFLRQTENFIRNEDWEKAKVSLEDSKKSWKQLKPLLQVDIDHDYVNNIEESFTKLDGYIDTREKGNSLATILLIKNEWDNIGSL
ncbi:MAG: DUF4363 family protein [Desulfotomaculaceae bacterium]|nr:DUF4363 family protein [Desulfotomaculaceae bacterium]